MLPSVARSAAISDGVRPLDARRMDPKRELVVVASRSHGGERLEAFIDALAQRFPSVNRTPVGSSLKLCILAEGRADFYPRLGPTSEWDIAAAHAVLEAAGGARMDVRSRAAALQHEGVVAESGVSRGRRRAFDWWSALAADRAGVNPSVALRTFETL